jgi:SAM-dependent methyltransferase/ribosomal protein S27E
MGGELTSTATGSEPTGWEEVGCDLCGGRPYSNFIDVEARRTKVSRPMTLVRCHGCGLIYLNPRPGQEIIGEFYGSEYYAHSGMQRRQTTVRGRLRNRFLEGLGGYGASLDLWLIRRLAPIGLIDIIIPSGRRGRLLDVGCGDGERADWYQKRGFEAYGVEVSERGAANARKIGVKVHQGTLSSAEYPDCFFDVVVMSHVLEHTHSPREYLAESFRILKPGGMLAVAVPNIESRSADVFKSDWSFLQLPIHLYHFSVDTLTAYLCRSGFSIDSLVGKIVYPRMVRRSCRSVRQHKPMRAFLKAWFLSGVLQSGFASLKTGVRKCDTITAYCTRTGSNE